MLTLVAETGAVALAGLAEMAKFETYTSSTAITAACSSHIDHAQWTIKHFGTFWQKTTKKPKFTPQSNFPAHNLNFQ